MLFCASSMYVSGMVYLYITQFYHIKELIITAGIVSFHRTLLSLFALFWFALIFFPVILNVVYIMWSVKMKLWFAEIYLLPRERTNLLQLLGHESAPSLHKSFLTLLSNLGCFQFATKATFFFPLKVFCSVPIHMLFWNSFWVLIAISSFLTSILLQFSFQMEAVITELSAQAPVEVPL